MLILEGGCGDCHYVRYFSDRGYKVIGIDYTCNTIRKVNQFLPNIKVYTGNILSLNFPDNHFDAYYSGGVIEHFEEGIDKALVEAHRVLNNHGIFFVTVPHMNLTRKCAARFRQNRYKVDLDGRKSFIKENIKEFTVEPPPPDYHFHEYFFSTEEMYAFLSKYHFDIITEVPFSSIYGLLDLTLFRWLHGTDKTNRSVFNKLFSILIYLIQNIETSNSKLSDVISFLYGSLVGNLKLYVCSAVK
jgi:SAM-dependent methyltransferase